LAKKLDELELGKLMNPCRLTVLSLAVLFTCSSCGCPEDVNFVEIWQLKLGLRILNGQLLKQEELKLTKNTDLRYSEMLSLMNLVVSNPLIISQSSSTLDFLTNKTAQYIQKYVEDVTVSYYNTFITS
jgi:hypothetical protein